MHAMAVVLETYLETKIALKGKARNANTPDQLSLIKSLPQFFTDTLQKLDRKGDFKVEGSYGQGNMAGVPWVGVFNRQITESAQYGYYIVLLFSEDMTACYLSLNQGVTALEKTYGSKVAAHKLRDTAQFVAAAFSPGPGAFMGRIDLNATRALGKGYENGAIESYKYDAHSLPTEAKFEADFLALLKHYDALVERMGSNLQAHTPTSEVQFQQAVLEKAVDTEKGASAFVERPGGVPIPPQKVTGAPAKHMRNPMAAAHAIKSAAYRCELNAEHHTFTSTSKGAPYVEAHHLIPLSLQSSFTFSLDVTANIVALCPTCHRQLHHGLAAEKLEPLRKLLDGRRNRLAEKKIPIDERKLLRIYNKDLLDEDA